MSDPAVKLTLALCIIVGGFLAAMAFRSEPTDTPSMAPTLSELMALRNRRPASQPPTAVPRGTGSCAPERQQTAPSMPARAATVITPLDNPPPVPPLSAKYPGDGLAHSTGWGMPYAAEREGKQTSPTTRIHRIVDGDTLPALAERYLGTPDRALEIFQANREALSDPELLPIGGELRIPQ